MYNSSPEDPVVNISGRPFDPDFYFYDNASNRVCAKKRLSKEMRMSDHYKNSLLEILNETAGMDGRMIFSASEVLGRPASTDGTRVYEIIADYSGTESDEIVSLHFNSHFHDAINYLDGSY